MQSNTHPVLVIVGAWNQLIFSKDWVKEFLFPEVDIIVENPVVPNTTIAFGTEDYRILIQENRLTFFALQETPEVYADIEKRAVQILKLLNHTPLSAFGINFVFHLNYTEALLHIKPVEDQIFFKGQGYYEDVVVLHRTFIKDNYQLTVTFNFSTNDVKVDVNFNFQINSSNLFLELFKDGLLQEKKTEIMQLIKMRYD